jgi:hypothetical protein
MSRKHNSLDDALHKRIVDLCAKGDDLVERREFEKAFGYYRDALNQVPQPAEDWSATTCILSAIGDLYFLAGESTSRLPPLRMPFGVQAAWGIRSFICDWAMPI